MKKLFFLFACAAVVTCPVAQAKTKLKSRSAKWYQRQLAAESKQLKFYADRFQFGMGAFRSFEGRISGATQLSWTPTWQAAHNFRIKWSLGALLNNVDRGLVKVLTDTSMSFVLVSRVSPLVVELGGGAQYWDGFGGWNPLVRVGTTYRFRGSPAPIHGINLSYSVISNSDVKTHQVMVGFAFAL